MNIGGSFAILTGVAISVMGCPWDWLEGGWVEIGGGREKGKRRGRRVVEKREIGEEEEEGSRIKGGKGGGAER